MEKIVIFDLDGTLLDSIKDLVLAANETRAYFNLPPLSEELISSFVGDGIIKFVERLFNKSSRIEKEIEIFKIKYRLHIVDNTRPYEGILETVREIKKRNYLVGVLSNKTEALTKLVLKKLDLISEFDFIYGGNSFPEKKPSKIPVESILKEFDGDRKNSYIVGDSCNDIISGKRAKIKTIGVTYGFSGDKLLNFCKPDYVAKKPEEIQKFIN